MYCILFCFVIFLKPFIVLLSSSALWDWILSGLSPCFCLCRITSLLLPPWFPCPPSLPPQPLAGPEARCPSRDELWVTEYFQISVLDLSSATDLPYWGHLCLSYVSTMPRILPSVSPSEFQFHHLLPKPACVSFDVSPTSFPISSSWPSAYFSPLSACSEIVTLFPLFIVLLGSLSPHQLSMCLSFAPDSIHGVFQVSVWIFSEKRHHSDFISDSV